ncbi:MAG: hypothetical protein DMD80_27180 [Candidatus Rokuibacteriota bacterium]|nr:MAG: hypothetical protein DMD80_27180 [Candidatus Rokubacteria bacterium]
MERRAISSTECWRAGNPPRTSSPRRRSSRCRWRSTRPRDPAAPWRRSRCDDDRGDRARSGGHRRARSDADARARRHALARRAGELATSLGPKRHPRHRRAEDGRPLPPQHPRDRRPDHRRSGPGHRPDRRRGAPFARPRDRRHRCLVDAAAVLQRPRRRCGGRAVHSRQTGVPISTHTWAAGRSGEAQQAIFAQEGVDLSRVVIGHSGDSEDLEYLRGLMERGSTIGMDRFGLEHFLPTAKRVEVLARLCAEGYAGKMVLSHDANCWTDMLSEDDKRRTRRSSTGTALDR